MQSIKKCLYWLGTLGFAGNLYADEFHIKYSSNYLMPAYVQFKNDGVHYSVVSKINVPLYNIVFNANGREIDQQFHLLSYRDTRNGKNYAIVEIDSNTIQYGKVKEPLKSVPLTMPTFDLFSLAFQLSYYDKLPERFQTTNGKKLYPAENVVLDKSVQSIKLKGKMVEEITYRFQTGGKNIIVKKHQGEKFPRYIAYNRDGDNYELTFDRFEK